jgi:hypothetical protein
MSRDWRRLHIGQDFPLVGELQRQGRRVVELGERAITQRSRDAIVTVPKVAYEHMRDPPEECYVFYFPRQARLVYQLPERGAVEGRDLEWGSRIVHSDGPAVDYPFGNPGDSA